MYSVSIWVCQGVVLVKYTAFVACCSQSFPVYPSDVWDIEVSYAELLMTLSGIR